MCIAGVPIRAVWMIVVTSYSTAKHLINRRNACMAARAVPNPIKQTLALLITSIEITKSKGEWDNLG